MFVLNLTNLILFGASDAQNLELADDGNNEGKIMLLQLYNI